MPAGASLRFFAESDESVIRTACDGERGVGYHNGLFI